MGFKYAFFDNSWWKWRLKVHVNLYLRKKNGRELEKRMER